MVWGTNAALDFPSYGGLDICHHLMKDCRPSIQLIMPTINNMLYYILTNGLDIELWVAFPYS